MTHHATTTMSNRKTIVSIMGTRPEVIKMAPVVRELERHSSRFRSIVLCTGQHRELLQQALHAFDIKADVELDLMEDNQGLAEFAARSLTAVSEVLDDIHPDMVLVQGDTTTMVTSALAAFYKRIAVGHVEAGLRSFDRANPFPEEINRCLAANLADLHFAPTEAARRNLISMGVPADHVLVTGNTIVDALHSVKPARDYDNPELGAIASMPERIILVTAHRRENHGVRMQAICRALLAIVSAHPDVRIVWPVHPNPQVVAIADELLSCVDRIHLVPPTTYGDILRLMKRSYVIMSDSGGIQEEAPSLRKPLLVLREVTERPEGVEVGAARLVGTDVETILNEIGWLLTDEEAYERMRSAPNPFGDGHAARRIVSAISKRLHLSDHLDYAADPVPMLAIPRRRSRPVPA
ncbi:MAG: UDP-N-acetylglucosamine 2-epimerase [Gemmatimonadetes bacterium]|nr:UDP-N-acetylglucosamine 2-epimerase [Gemmatimonadota bacterium]